MKNRIRVLGFMIMALIFSLCAFSYAADRRIREEKRKEELNELQKRFEWWPTDAKPAPVKDPERGGYWWQPQNPGNVRPWGNREYTVKSGDTLSKIAKEQLGGAHRWKYLYEINKDRINDPNKLKVGKKITIPVE